MEYQYQYPVSVLLSAVSITACIWSRLFSEKTNIRKHGYAYDEKLTQPL